MRLGDHATKAWAENRAAAPRWNRRIECRGQTSYLGITPSSPPRPPPTTMSRISLAVAFCLVSAAVAPAGEPTLDESGFRQHVAPFFQKHCVECHGPEQSEGDLKLHEVRLADFAAG